MNNKVWKIFINFFKFIWYALNSIRKLFFNILLIFFIIISVYIYLQFKKTSIETVISKNTALKINLVGIITDKVISDNSLLNKFNNNFLSENHKKQETSLFFIINAIRNAKNDKNISGIVLELQNFIGADQPSLDYIGKVLKEFRNSGKPIYAISDNYTQSQYYLASFSNTIYLAPYGEVDLHGFSMNNLYYKNLLNKLKIDSNVFRIGNYKSAVEPFIRDNMSFTVREMNNRWIQTLWKNYLYVISKNRKINFNILFPEVNIMLKELKKLSGNTASYAIKHNLVDKLDYKYNIEKFLEKKFGYNNNTHEYNNISIYDYYSIKKFNYKKGNIAVILINGIINNNKESSNIFKNNKIIEQINSARLNNNIKAIILRINSPGGSVNASEEIRSELLSVKNSGKPIVVSMGGTAASGGYWISTPANYIIASSNTITGSIGIFGIINTLENFLKTIGIYSDGVYTSPLANIFITKTLPQEVKNLIQLKIQNTYKNFIHLVSKSRKQTIEKIEKIAQGIIWTGSDAKKYGLIDEIGDFDHAIKKASELGKIKTVKLSWYQESENTLNDIINILFYTKNFSLFNKYLENNFLFLILDILKNNEWMYYKKNYLYALCTKCYNTNIN